MDDQTPPPFAQLTAGVTAKELREGIAKSGYPLQATVADIIRSSPLSELHSFDIQEEWAFIDRDTEQARSIDILVDAAFRFDYQNPKSRLRTRLNLLIECKQSDFPYIFFLRQPPPNARNDFPEIVGLDSETLRVFSPAMQEEGTETDSFSCWMDVRDALEFKSIPFFGSPTLSAISFARAVRRGPKLEITGEDAYRSLTLPLLKAADHLRSLGQPQPNHPLYFPRLVINIAVVRAPMIGVFPAHGETDLIALPWVRVSHLEPTMGGNGKRDLNGSIRYFDVVHESFLAKYLGFLARDATRAAQRMHQHSKEVASGLAFSDMENGHRSLTPLPEHYMKFLEKPCTISMALHVKHAAMRIEMDSSNRKGADDIDWIDGYDWLL